MPEPVGVVDGVAGLVSHDSLAPLAVAAFHFAHHLSLELLQAWVGEIERHGKAGNAVRRKPLGRQPDVRPESQPAALELVVQLLDLGPQRAAPERQPEAAEAEVEERLVVVIGPVIVEVAGRRRLSGGNHSTEDTGQGDRARILPATRVSAARAKVSGRLVVRTSLIARCVWPNTPSARRNRVASLSVASVIVMPVQPIHTVTKVMLSMSCAPPMQRRD